MKKFLSIVLTVCVLASFLGCEKLITDLLEESPAYSFLGKGSYSGDYWPTYGWRSCRPEEVNMDPEKLMKVYEYVSNPNINTDGILIVKDGYIVGEAYFNGYTKNINHNGQGMTIGFTNALIGIALDKGLIGSIDEEIYHYFPQLQTNDTPEIKKRIRIRHLLNMTAGLDWENYEYNNHGDNGRMYERGIVDFIEYVLAKPVITEPGTDWFYSDGTAILPTGIIEKVTNQRAYHFAEENLFQPLGISDVYWESDPAGHTITAWGIHTTVRNFAKFGYLYLNEGQWGDQQIVPNVWVKESTTAISDSLNHFGMQWWLPPAFSEYKNIDIPEKTFIAMGGFIQRIFVVPEKNIVVVRVGNDVETTDGQWSSLKFLRLVLDAVKE